MADNIIHIDDFCEDVKVYKNLNEAMLYHFFEPDEGLFMAESMKVIERALHRGYEPLSVLVDADKEKSSEFEALSFMLPNIPIYVLPHERMIEITGINLTGGIISAFRRKKEDNLSGILKLKKIVILERVVNPSNIGAIFRSAAAFNIDGIILKKGCCDPYTRRAIRVSMGNVFNIPWGYFEGDDTTVNEHDFALLHENNYKTIAMALKSDSIKLSDERLKKNEKIAIFLGNEGDGLSDNVVNSVDYKVIIPMAHEVDSLNVAAASAVAFWELARKQK